MRWGGVGLGRIGMGWDCVGWLGLHGMSVGWDEIGWNGEDEAEDTFCKQGSNLPKCTVSQASMKCMQGLGSVGVCRSCYTEGRDVAAG